MRVNRGVIEKSLLIFWCSTTSLRPESIIRRVQGFFEIVNSNPDPSKFDFLVIPEEHVNKGSGQTGIGCNEIVDVSCSEIRSTDLVHQGIVGGEIRIQNQCLVIRYIVSAIRGGVEEQLRHNGKSWALQMLL